MNQPSIPAPLAAVSPAPIAGRPVFYNVAEAAEIVRLDESTLYRHLRAGRFPGLKIGGRYVVPRVALDRLIEDILTAGRCLDIADWTGDWRAAQEQAAEQVRSFGVVAGGVPR